MCRRRARRQIDGRQPVQQIRGLNRDRARGDAQDARHGHLRKREECLRLNEARSSGGPFGIHP